MTKIAVTTLGCKVNQYESAGLMEELKERGFEMVPFDAEADVYIVNTCTVTGRTDYQSRQLIRRANRKNPNASIVVTGCYAQTSPHEISQLPGVTLVAGTGEKETIPYMIHEIPGTECTITVSDISEKKSYSGMPVSHFPGHTRSFLKIQDGCDSFCSYCIVPYARGRSRSLSEYDVMRQIHRLRNAGHREIVLSGVHLGQWGLDFTPPLSLLDLLRRIEIEKAVQRLRLSSIEPTEITDEIIDHILHSVLICRHLHIPLQSGDDMILKAMNRHYTADHFKNRIEAITSAIPDMAIGIDVMVGFPGEDEKAFENTRRFIEELPVAYLHVFPYSSRPGTAAADFSDQIPDSVKKERGKILRDIGKLKRIAYNKKFIGRELSVLAENTGDRETGLMKGFSNNYIPVLIENGETWMSNQIITVIAESLAGGKILGRKISTPER